METITVPNNLPMTIDREALAQICRRYHVQELALFGSVLRTDFGPASDVDVLVDLASTTPIKSLLDRARLAVELEGIFSRTVDLTDKKRLYPLLAQEILSTAQVLYAAAE